METELKWIRKRRKKHENQIHWEAENGWLWFFTLRVRARNNSSIANLTKTLRFPLFLIFSFFYMILLYVL